MKTLSTSLTHSTMRRPATTVCLAIIATGSLLTAPRAFAPPEDGANCRACHTTVLDGMYLTGNQSTTNLGAGLLKVYQVTQGQTAAIGIQLTNRYGSLYALSLLNLEAPGEANAANQLDYTGDPTWTDRQDGSIDYFTLGPSTGTFPQSKTHNLAIATNTPADIYKVQLQMAGPANDEWSQVVDFYLQVLPLTPPTPTAPVITSPTYNAGQFSVTVATEAGHTYHLEYKDALTDPSWTEASQVAGDDTSKVLTDSSASEPRRFYRVRAQ